MIGRVLGRYNCPFTVEILLSFYWGDAIVLFTGETLMPFYRGDTIALYWGDNIALLLGR